MDNEDKDTSNGEDVDNYEYDNLSNVKSRNHKNKILSSEESGEGKDKSTTAETGEKSQDDTENVKHDIKGYGSEDSSDSGTYEESDQKQRILSTEVPIEHQGKLENDAYSTLITEILYVQPIENGE